MLLNIFLHPVLDKWFEDEVRRRMRGKATLVRFADDFVMTFETHYDAKRVMDVLAKRLGRFGLTRHPDKTRFIDFRPQRLGGTPPDCKVQSFDFLGFTHSWGKSRNGKDVVRQTTAKSRFARSLAVVKEWCRTNRHWSAREQRIWLSAALNGHYAYYDITGNIRRLQDYRYQVVRIWHSGWNDEREEPSARSSPVASGEDHPLLHWPKRISRVRNRMLELGTSGSVGAKGATSSTLPADEGNLPVQEH